MKKGKYYISKEGELYIFDNIWFENDFVKNESQEFLIYRISGDTELVFDSRTSQEKVSVVIGKREGIYRCCFINDQGKTTKTKTIVIQKGGLFVRIKLKYTSKNTRREEEYTCTKSYLEKLEELTAENCEVFYEFSEFFIPLTNLFHNKEFKFISFYLEACFNKICETGENNTLNMLLTWVFYLKTGLVENEKNERNHFVLKMLELINDQATEKYINFFEDELMEDFAIEYAAEKAEKYYDDLTRKMSSEGLKSFYEGYNDIWLGVER